MLLLLPLLLLLLMNVLLPILKSTNCLARELSSKSNYIGLGIYFSLLLVEGEAGQQLVLGDG